MNAAGLRVYQNETLTSNSHSSYGRRRSDLIVLLRTLTTVGETLQRGDSGGRFEPGPKILQMPAAWHAGSYAELLGALTALRKHGPRHYWTVDQRYISPERTNRTLVFRQSAKPGRQYFEALDSTAFNGPKQVIAGEAVNMACTEILSAKVEPKVRVVLRTGEVRAVCVRAIVERWDPAVERRPLETGIDFLLSQMPGSIRLPREVRAAA